MSKAFINDDAVEPDPPPDTLRARLGNGPRYVTPAGFEALTAEREALMREPARNEHRLRWLDMLLPRLVVVRPDPARAGRRLVT